MQGNQDIPTEELVNRSLQQNKSREFFETIIALFIFTMSAYGAYEATKYLNTSLFWRVVMTIGYAFAVIFFSIGFAKKG